MATCPKDEPCFLNRENLELLQAMNCQLRQNLHKLQCCSTRIKGGNHTPCHCAAEVTAEDMKEMLLALEKSARELKEEVEAHDNLHQLRTKKGREQARESGYLSVNSGINQLPVQEEGLPELQVSPLPTTREATENQDYSASTRM